MSKNKNGFLSESDMQNVKDKIIEKTICNQRAFAGDYREEKTGAYSKGENRP